MSVLASHKSPAKASRNTANKEVTHNETHGVAEVQTEAIMVPFPLPPIGTIKPETKPVESVSMQTEYTWMFNEFPTKREDFCMVERTQKSRIVMKPAAVSDMSSNAASPKKKVSQKSKIVREQEPEPVVVVAPEPATVAPEAVVTGEATFAVETEDAVMSEESAFVAQTETAAAEEETQPPRQRPRRRKREVPASRRL